MLKPTLRSIEEKKKLVKQIETMKKAGSPMSEIASQLEIKVFDYYRWRTEIGKASGKKKRKTRKTYTRKRTEPQAEIFHPEQMKVDATPVAPPQEAMEFEWVKRDRVFAFYGNAKEVASVVRSLQ